MFILSCPTLKNRQTRYEPASYTLNKYKLGLIRKNNQANPQRTPRECATPCETPGSVGYVAFKTSERNLSHSQLRGFNFAGGSLFSAVLNPYDLRRVFAVTSNIFLLRFLRMVAVCGMEPWGSPGEWRNFIWYTAKGIHSVVQLCSSRIWGKENLFIYNANWPRQCFLWKLKCACLTFKILDSTWNLWTVLQVI